MLTTLFLQILSNLANDYGDAEHGADHDERKGPKRMVSSGRISAKDMKWGMLVLGLLALFSGTYLLWISFGLVAWSYFIFMFVVGMSAIWAALRYTTGAKPYGYVGLGDVFVFLFFGWVGVTGTALLYTHTIQWSSFLTASACGWLAVGVLNLNNMRDIQSDATAGKRSVPVRLGIQNAKKYHYALIISAMLGLTCFTIIEYENAWQWLFLAFFPILILHIQKVKNAQDHSALDALLKPLALSTFFISLLFFLGIIVG